MSKSKEQLNNKGDRRGVHPNSLKNLELARKKGKGWQRGKSGNPNGYSLTGLVRDSLDKVPTVKIDGKANTKTWMELIVQAWLVGAYKGNATYFKELMERVEGKVAQPLTGAEGEPLIPPIVEYHFPDGTVMKPPRNGKVLEEAEAIVENYDGNGSKSTEG